MLDRERAARLEAEGVAEQGLRDLYVSKQRLALLEKVAAVANESDSAISAIDRILSEVCAFTGWAFAHAYSRSGHGAKLTSAGVAWADDRADLAAFLQASLAAEFDDGAGLPGRVLAKNQSFWIRDLEVDEKFIRRDVALACGLRSAFAVPVLVANRCEAVLEFYSRAHVDPDADLLDLMRHVATQLGRVIERERLTQRLAYQANHDALTGLLNRTAFSRELDICLAELEGAPYRHLALALFDIDDFGTINGLVGHAAADRLLASMPDAIQRVAANLPFYDLRVGRFGADEFAVLAIGEDGELDPQQIGACFTRVLDGLCASVLAIEASVSTGIVVAGPMHNDVDDLLRDASAALCEAKTRGRGQTVFFDLNMRNQSERRSALERELRRALDNEELSVGYQPIVSLYDGRVTGVEALARWRHGKEAISPGEFIPLAEACGLIVPLGERVLLESCRMMAKVNKRRSMPLSVSVNVSPLQFMQPNFGQHVLHVLRETGLPGMLLRLEITEGVAMQDITRTCGVLEELCAAQVRVSLDDFGTGFSSLSYLSRLPVDTLKIDRSFVNQLADGLEGEAIVRAILDLSRALSMDVIAEGVECEKQASFLKEHGCSHAQGYYYSKAAEVDVVTTLGSFGCLPAKAA